MANRALIVIDLQNDYFPGGKWTLHNIDTAADNAARLLAAARDAEDLIVHVRHEFPSEEAPFFAPGSEGARIHEKVLPAEAEPVVLKHHVNSFRETALNDLLSERDVRELTICGAMSHMCVDAGVRAAHDFGYDVTLVHDACASRDMEFNGVTIPAEKVHSAYMAALAFAYANVLSTNEYLRVRASNRTQ